MCTGMEALFLGSMVASAGGAYIQGQQQRQAAEYNAQVAANQARMQQYQASLTEQAAVEDKERTQYELDAHRRQVARATGSQRAAIAAAGGSLLDAGDVMAMSEEEAELDALSIMYGGEQRQRAYEQQAWAQRMGAQSTMTQAGFYGTQGRQAAQAGAFGAGTSLLTSGMYAKEKGIF